MLCLYKTEKIFIPGGDSWWGWWGVLFAEHCLSRFNVLGL